MPRYIPEIDIREIDTISDFQLSNLNEVRILPFNTYLAATLDGQKLYTSEGLIKAYLEAMGGLKRMKPIIPKLKDMIDKDQLFVCWMNKNILKLALFKIFADRAKQSVAGFYHGGAHQIFLLIDNNIDMLGRATNAYLGHLTLHEGMHMAAKTMKGSFLKLFQTEFDAYYSELFGAIFGIPDNKNITKGVREIYTFLFFEHELGERYSISSSLDKYKKLLIKNFRPVTVDKDIFDERVERYILFLLTYHKNVNSFMATYKNYPDIVKPMYTAYQNIERVNLNEFRTMCIQELFYPSEVICIHSEFTKKNVNKIHKAFNSIKKK